MANIQEVSQFQSSVYELATTDPVEGGPGGISNAQAQVLANRTLWLKDQQALMWLTGDVKEIDCDNAYIIANFDSTGLGQGNRLGWAICNGQNGTRNRNGLVGVAWGTLYNTMGVTFGSKDAVVIDHDHLLAKQTIVANNNDLTSANYITRIGESAGDGSYVLRGGSGVPDIGKSSRNGVSGTNKNMQPSIVSLFIMKL